MSTVVLYFQMHQPLRLRRYSVFDTDPDYFDTALNRSVLQRVSDKCYGPGLSKMLELIRRHRGRFRVSFGITGVLLDQLRESQPQVVKLLEDLGRCQEVEFVNEPYHHSLSFLYSRDEFREQVDRHAKAMEELTGRLPVVFRNTEMIYNDELASYLDALGRFRGVLAEGVDRLLEGRSVAQAYRPPHTANLAILLRNFELSDDVAFRFSNRDWPGWPLTPQKFAQSVTRFGERGPLCNVFIDFESFGEHHWPETGIFEFLDAMPQAVLDASAGNAFATVSQAMDAHPAREVFDCPRMISWADSERDLSAWLGNAMQSNAIQELYKLEEPVKRSGDARLLEDWRRLTISDHCYYMCTKYFSDMAVHNYFNPYESPYDSYINFMNVLDNVRHRAGLAAGGGR
jgi:alpha-amylase